MFFCRSFRQNHVPWGRLSLWKWVPGISRGVKTAGAFGWRPTTLVVPKVEKIRGLNLPGTPRATSACRGIPLLYFTTWGGWSTPRPGRFTPGKDPVPIVQDAGWAVGAVWTSAEIFAPTGIRSPDRPARSESLYRLRYPDSMLVSLPFITHFSLFIRVYKSGRKFVLP